MNQKILREWSNKNTGDLWNLSHNKTCSRILDRAKKFNIAIEKPAFCPFDHDNPKHQIFGNKIIIFFLFLSIYFDDLWATNLLIFFCFFKNVMYIQNHFEIIFFFFNTIVCKVAKKVSVSYINKLEIVSVE